MKKIISLFALIISISSYAQLRLTAPVYTASTQTLTNKSIDADANILTNIENADIKIAAAIDATKLIDGSISNTELGYINTLSSNAQTQLTNRVKKGGDTDGSDLTIGTLDANNLVFTTNSNPLWKINSSGYLSRGLATSNFGLQLGSTGAGSVMTFGDVFDASTPYIALREHGGTDVDQLEAYAQKGIYFVTNTYGSTARLTIQQDGDIIYGGETQVTGAEHTFIGDADISGNLNVQGNSTVGSYLKYKTASTPSTPANGTEFNLYYKANKFIIQYNDGGTTRYKYLDLTGTGTTWVATTTAP